MILTNTGRQLSDPANVLRLRSVLLSSKSLLAYITAACNV